jgi:predicted nucleic acid-binding protein
LIAYVDSSVLLRVAFAEPGQLAQWRKLEQGVASELCRVECLRTVDRQRLRASLDDEEVAQRHAAVHDALERLRLVPVTAEVLARAAQPFPTSLGTLDAIHLATALLWQESGRDRLEGLLTHDAELGRAARAVGFVALGCD